MIRAFITTGGKPVGINPAMVLAIEANEQGGTLIIMGHSYSYQVTDPIHDVLLRLNAVGVPGDGEYRPAPDPAARSLVAD